MFIFWKNRRIKKYFTHLSAWSISKQVFNHSQGSVRAGEHILQQQLVREHLEQLKKKNQNKT